MTNSQLVAEKLSLDAIHHFSMLCGPELLSQVTQFLHKTFNSHSSMVIELDKMRYKAHNLCCASIEPSSLEQHYELQGTPCEQVGLQQQPYCIFTNKVAELFPSDTYLVENNIEAYLGIPIYFSSGENYGVLISTFTRPLEDFANLVLIHQILAQMIAHDLECKQMAARSQSLVNQLRHEISHDNLTGLMNRNDLADKLDALIQRGQHHFTLAFLDIDEFRSINDLYGHFLGDAVLKFVASAIEQALPEEQHAFRIAADEFAFLTTDHEPMKICQTILNKLSQDYVDQDRRIKVSVSIGIAKYSGERLTADQILFNASLALEECKRNHNTHIRFYDTLLSNQYYRRTQIIDALRSELSKPIHQTELYVVVQPIVKRNQQKWDYFEILTRWKSSSLGFVTPLEFIEAAEQSGLIIELGERILELACIAKMELEHGLERKVHLSINCSADELTNSNRYLEHLLKSIQTYGFQPTEFTIELTETVLLSKAAEVCSVLTVLRELGFRIALDDFGTGYSSLNYIHSYPIDCIKIDAAFVRNLLTNQTSESIVWLIIQLANQLKLDLVAEGVENQQALDKLYQMGCEQIQGYYFSKPDLPSVMVERQLPSTQQTPANPNH
ncbi:putative bifunctional diguanylate cyclase/phosphodiesterase [Vibrio metoecus]|uniref:putative bifunctional diguanylate cyclase/phosphodiesterase n=1 Tax=Vibrio metoecus TaxID=1481663 RepID=UPI0006D8613F|nr:bifunctional diguanylate cyclase/phosphodiesterase [Vibrio metoecus]KQA20660.1 diguanylate cyclase [Vibrio metoecus]